MNEVPKLYLFLSVDVIDSTKMKYSQKEGFDWINEISGFYGEYPGELESQILALKKSYRLNNSNQLNIWKYSGDEILFYIEITEKNQIPEIIDAFANSLVAFTEDKKIQSELKGTAWIGQVPFIDIDFEKGGKRDFIGTSIDCGFRLGKYASKYELIISIEVAKLCCECNKFHQTIVFLGRENLKGVLGDFKYPLFAVQLSFERAEKNLMSQCNNHVSPYITTVINEINSHDKNKIQLVDSDVNTYLKLQTEISKEIAGKYKDLQLFNSDEISTDIDTENTEINQQDYEDLINQLKSESKNVLAK